MATYYSSSDRLRREAGGGRGTNWRRAPARL